MEHMPDATPSEPAPETWLDLEKLAARIYSELAAGCAVAHDARLPGKESGTTRQIDVLIRCEEAGTLVVVDCKDWLRRVNVNDAYQFAGLLADVEATGGILICNRGFSEAARAVAKRRGFSLCQLHDVSSRKWRIDVLVPIVWTRVHVSDLRVGMVAHFEAGDSLQRNAAPKFLIDGRDFDPTSLFEAEWNAGNVATRPGRYLWTVRAELLTLEGARREADVSIECTVEGESKLGYVTPQESRGILEADTGAYFTAVLDIGKTVCQEPEGGWQDISNPDELAISIRGTVVTMDDVAGITAEWTGLESMLRIGD